MAERAAADQGLRLTALVADTAAALADFARGGARFDSVVVNPPRRGVAPEVRRLLGELGATRLVYISCNPETLARDAAHLAVVGYALRAATPFDMIPQSDAVEALAVFEPSRPPSPRVLAEGDGFLVVDKEPHVAVAGRAASSLEARVRALPGAEHAVAVDRIDDDASGACVFARRPADVPELEQALARGRAESRVLVRGVIRAKSTLPNQGKLGPNARYERLETQAGHSLLEVRTPPAADDDARRALASFRHPVLGDGRHGDRRANVHFAMRHDLDRCFWHRQRLELDLSETRVRAEAALAPDLEAVLASAAKG
jgi:23S rRNA (uracil1939-C5)-methyltransferase